MCLCTLPQDKNSVFSSQFLNKAVPSGNTINLKPIIGNIVIDLFWNRFCLTSDVEVQRVREVVSEYGKDVILNEFSAVDQKILQQYGIERRIYVNGEIIEVGPEVEKSKMREAIKNALNKLN